MLRLVAQLACQMSPGITVEQLLYLLALGRGQATVEVAVTLKGYREQRMFLNLNSHSFGAPSCLG